MKILILGLALFACIQGDAVKCIQGDATEATVCTDASVTKCKSPIFTEYTGVISDQDYGCGPCDEDSSATCEECTSSAEAACNGRIEVGEDFKCAAYSYDEASKSFAKGKEDAVCKRLKATANVCNKPTATAAADYVQNKDGCGPCTDAAKEAKTCEECASDKCSSAATMSLLALAAVIYNMI